LRIGERVCMKQRLIQMLWKSVANSIEDFMGRY
jgi:hypothetical protein